MVQNADDPSTTNIFTAEKSPSDHNNKWGYIIAVMVIGTAFGNMFLAGKIKNVMKIKMPHIPKDQPFHRPNTSNAQQSQSSAGRKGPYYTDNTYKGYSKRNENDFLPDGLLDIPPYIQQHFKNLNIPVAGSLDEKFVKTAYRREAMKHHPDRVGNDVPNSAELKRQCELRFKDISNSYKFLLKNFTKRKTNKITEDKAGEEVV